jgi:hypothetical protein
MFKATLSEEAAAELRGRAERRARWEASRRVALLRWLEERLPLWLRVTTLVEGRALRARRCGTQVEVVRFWARPPDRPELEERPRRTLLVVRVFRGWRVAPGVDEADRIVAASETREPRMSRWSDTVLAQPSPRQGLLRYANTSLQETAPAEGEILQFDRDGPQVGDVLVRVPTEEDIARGVPTREMLLVMWVNANCAMVQRGYGRSPVESWPTGSTVRVAGHV